MAEGHLFEDILVLFSVDQAHDFKYASLDYHKSGNKDYGGIKVREFWSTFNPEYLQLIRGVQNWAGLKNIVMIIMKITFEFAKIKPLKTWQSCATSPSTCSNKRKPPKAVSEPNSCKPLGIRMISSKTSPQAIKMRLTYATFL